MNSIIRKFEEICIKSYISSRRYKPGEFVLKLSKEDRDFLKELKSDHIREVRIDNCVG